MNFSSDFEIPPAPEPVGKITEEQALDKAFYAAGAYGEDVVEEFLQKLLMNYLFLIPPLL